MKVIDGLIHDTVGFTCSCFDLLHAGHIIMLQYAKRRCDKLIVGLQTDPTLDRPDTKHKPIRGQPDVFIHPNICVFVDGDRWHANPKPFIYKNKKNPGFKSDDVI